MPVISLYANMLFHLLLLFLMQALVPIQGEVEIPYEHHSGIIGKSGQNIRKLMDKYQVNISVPHSEQKSNVIRITGLQNEVEEAKKGLLEEAAAIVCW